jgi:alpha-D-ribose 1-methylphosphonate 5-triphosphate diphosphatase PhnM
MPLATIKASWLLIAECRAEHRLHLRCELPHHTTLPLFEKLVDREPVTLVSLMDHSPGQRQFANREKRLGCDQAAASAICSSSKRNICSPLS